MRSVIPQGQAVEAETGQSDTLVNALGGYNHGTATEGGHRARKAQRVNNESSGLPATSGGSSGAGVPWQLEGYVRIKGTCGQGPDSTQRAGIDPNLRTSVAKKDSAARSLQLGPLHPPEHRRSHGPG